MSFPKKLDTDNESIELVEPDIERDSEIAIGWLEGELGKQTLLLMGVPEAKINEPTIEKERSRVTDFIELKTQYNWMIQLDGRIIGSVWVDLEDSDYVKSPSVHIMIGDQNSRGRGVGQSSIKAVVDFLANEKGYTKIFSRHLTTNAAADNLLSELGFAPEGEKYADEDGLEWQNLSLEKPNDFEQQVRNKIINDGVESLIVDDLNESDLNELDWAGDALHLEAINNALQRAKSGDVDYLAVRAPDGKVIAKGGIDYAKNDNSGYMWQLTTMESLRGLGIGTRLISAMEDRIKNKGLKIATLGVENDNPLARALYEKLGYEVYGHEQDSWERVGESGQSETHYAEVDLMQKQLG